MSLHMMLFRFPIVRFLRILCVLGLAYSCASFTKEQPPCDNGWTTVGTDVSKIVEPSDEFWREMKDQFMVDRSDVKCVHHLEQYEKYILIIEGNDFRYKTITIKKSGEKLELLERGVVV